MMSGHFWLQYVPTVMLHEEAALEHDTVSQP